MRIYLWLGIFSLLLFPLFGMKVVRKLWGGSRTITKDDCPICFKKLGDWPHKIDICSFAEGTHSVCLPCITEIMARGNHRCPICRKSFDIALKWFINNTVGVKEGNGKKEKQLKNILGDAVRLIRNYSTLYQRESESTEQQRAQISELNRMQAQLRERNSKFGKYMCIGIATSFVAGMTLAKCWGS